MSKLSGKPVTPLYLRSSMVYLSFLLNYSLSLSLSRCLPTAHIQTPACASLSLSSTHKSSNFDSCLYLPLNFFHNALSLSLFLTSLTNLTSFTAISISIFYILTTFQLFFFLSLSLPLAKIPFSFSLSFSIFLFFPCPKHFEIISNTTHPHRTRTQ